VCGIADIDTRRLTRLLRDKGAQNGCLMAGASRRDKALAAGAGVPGLKGMDLAKEVSTAPVSYPWTAGSWQLGEGHPEPGDRGMPWHVVAYDFGVKRNILRMLATAAVASPWCRRRRRPPRCWR
jgi:carbamoyl-phosphate synthase small subunit